MRFALTPNQTRGAKHRGWIVALLGCVVSCILFPAVGRANDTFDVVVYGGTPAGIMAAIQAARMGTRVILLEPKSVIGGMITAGLGATDTGAKRKIGGLAKEFFHRVNKVYGVRRRWILEPKIGLQVFEAMLAEQKNITVRKKWELAEVQRQGRRITALRSNAGETVSGKVFIDSSYEGDLLALAGVSHRIGREARLEYGESLAGVYPQSVDRFDVSINAYDSEGKLLPGISEAPLGEEGAGDKLLPAYNYRVCLTQNADNRIAFSKPEGYDVRQYELLARYIAAKRLTQLKDLFNILDLPGKKHDLNNKGPVSTDYVGQNKEYPAASPARRREIDRAHESYTRGMLWFLQTDERVPQSLRDMTATWGYCRDEFIDTGNWPHQLYVREARRMTGEYVLTQHDVQKDRTKEDAIGVASKPIEAHHAQRYVTPEGNVQNEGFVYTQLDGAIPYDVPYRALLPKRNESENLLVPACVSATHIAFSSLRMEPVYMILGMSSGAAAALAAKSGGIVHNVPYPELSRLLVERKQIISVTQIRVKKRKPRSRPAAAQKFKQQKAL